MKLYIALALVALLIIAAFILNATPKEVVAPETLPLAESQETTNEIPDATKSDMTSEEHATLAGESTTGSDVGMEMPIPDEDMSKNTAVSPSARVVTISGVNFAFDVTEIRVKRGETVTINFESSDGLHDLVIDEYNVRTEKLRTGGKQTVTFVADKVGTFEYYCSVGAHRVNGMVGKLIVE